MTFLLTFRSEPNCSGTSTFRARNADFKVFDAWSPNRKTLPVPLGSKSVEFGIVLNIAAASGDPVAGNYDNVVLEPTSGLLLGDGRYQIDVLWETSQGTKGYGRGVQLTSDSGYFWFFNADNVELIVKVLDGCGVNNHRWVFAGGLTDVKVTMDVLDRVAGYERTYTNPPGTPFQPLQDTNALPTCATP